MQIPNQGSVSPNGVRTMENLLIFWRKAPILKSLATLLPKPPKRSGNVAFRTPQHRQSESALFFESAIKKSRTSAQPITKNSVFALSQPAKNATTPGKTQKPLRIRGRAPVGKCIRKTINVLRTGNACARRADRTSYVPWLSDLGS